MNDGAAIVFHAIAPVAPAWRRPGTSVYTASKVALLSFTKTLATELVERSIRVNAISPGPTLTPIYEHAGVPPAAIEERQAKIANAPPMKRFATTDEVAAAVVVLASSDASYINGEEIGVDGAVWPEGRGSNGCSCQPLSVIVELSSQFHNEVQDVSSVASRPYYEVKGDGDHAKTDSSGSFWVCAVDASAASAQNGHPPITERLMSRDTTISNRR